MKPHFSLIHSQKYLALLLIYLIFGAFFKGWSGFIDNVTF